MVTILNLLGYELLFRHTHRALAIFVIVSLQQWLNRGNPLIFKTKMSFESNFFRLYHIGFWKCIDNKYE